MRFGILGPVRAEADGQPIPLPAKPRAVLATLLLYPGTFVSRERLIASAWEDPPRSAAANLYTYVSQLRQAGIVVDNQASSYRLRGITDRLDLLTFRQVVQLARESARTGDLAAAHAQFNAAFMLQRGKPVEDAQLASAAAGRVAELDEEVSRARSDWVEVRLGLGLYDELVGELAALVTAEPLRERQWRQLMLALFRIGRRAEALDCYQRARSALVAELGIEPGHELRTLHQAVLDDNGVADDVAAGPMKPATLPRRSIVGRLGGSVGGYGCLLPPDISDFVGRELELESIDASLHRGGRGNGFAPAIVSLIGPPGVGKSTLAIHAAHRARERYPDGQLFVRLGGSRRPRNPANVLGGLLRSLGIDPARIPPSLVERTAMYRAKIADRSVLVVLDDVSDEAQVQPLLPGTSTGGVIVTSRGLLAALAGSTIVPVDVPSSADARLMLAELIGYDRVEREPDSAAAIVRACERLPLALRVIGARLATHPAWSLTEFAARLLHTPTLLDELRFGAYDVRATFATSYAALCPDTRRVFRRLGSAATQWPAPLTASAFVGEPWRVVDQALETLVRAGLVTAEEGDDGRRGYRVPGLLRTYAWELMAAPGADEHDVTPPA